MRGRAQSTSQLLSAVDSDSYNAVQYYTALLAEAGMVNAVVTTNFDRNFERAFGDAGVAYHSYFDEDGFNRLRVGDLQVLPIVKIHGCCFSPGSMIDTRKQRLKGRAHALQSALLQLIQQHHFLFAGFSGQDLDDNGNYLGLRDAAASAKGFTYLHLPGYSVRESMKQLLNFYGEKKACTVECDPAEYLAELLKTQKSRLCRLLLLTRLMFRSQRD
ncbi:MAG: SIR2 family protein [Comamonadaceae bacterium]|nr:SIR2 family protein [Comamonadaceae bacterium]